MLGIAISAFFSGTGSVAGNAQARIRLKPAFFVLDHETVVASVVATAPPYNADSSGEHDATAAIQAALDAVAAARGGVVFLPAGRYRVTGGLRVGQGTTLQGVWKPPDLDGIGAGTVLLAYAERNTPDSPPLILLTPHRETAVRGLTVWYPEQRPGNIIPYPPTIGGGIAHISDVTLCNSYIGIRLDLLNACVIQNVVGTVLQSGIVAPKSTEFSWMHDIHFSNDYWPRARQRFTGVQMSDTDRAAIDRFTGLHLTGLELGRIDGLAIYRFRADSAETPVLIRKSRNVAQHPVFGFGGVVAGFPGKRVETGWDPWYYGMHYANVDNVPEAKGKRYTFARIPLPRRTDAGSFLDVTAPPYSAAGDGVSDDTSAIQRALAAAGRRGGGTVYLPQGEFKITQPLTVPAGVELRGPLGAEKIRQFKETCSLAVYCGRGAENPATAPAAITLMAHSGVHGFNIVYPEQSYDVSKLVRYPYSIRGNGAGLWIVDMHLLNACYGIDLASHRCDGHVVAGLWGTVFFKGIVVGGGSRNGKLERMAFSYGPWTAAGRLAGIRTRAGTAAVAEFCHENNVHYTFGNCVGETTWGLVGFYPKIHFLFTGGQGHGCRNAEFWESLHDVAAEANIKADSGKNIDLIGYFGTGGRDKRHNWLEVAPHFEGPLKVYAKTIQQTFLNHPYDFRSDQVRFYDEVSLTTFRPVIADRTAPGSRPENAVDRDSRTLWIAPTGSWLQVDLGQVHTIDRVRIESAGLFMDRKYNSDAAELQVSVDSRTFTRVAVLKTNRFAWTDMPVPPVAARWVRLVVTDPGDDGVIRIASFDVFGL